ncbi:hypothetical protein C8Q79DRAFT_267706 [Trametes meyenii]|nr:hypothetical protein C8Q79DRAFT_267706 [Trametes meyenii]
MEVDMDKLRETALEFITKLVKTDKLHDFTYGTYRSGVERVMSLPRGTLNAPEYKKVVNTVAKDYINELEEQKRLAEQDANPQAVPEPDGSRIEPDSKGGSSIPESEVIPTKPTVKNGPAKPIAEEDITKSVVEGPIHHVTEDAPVQVVSPTEDVQPEAMLATETKPTSKKSGKPKQAVRSASVVPTSDEEAGNVPDPKSSSEKPKSRTASAKNSKTKRVASESEDSDSDDQSSEPPSKRLKKSTTTPTSREGWAQSANPDSSASADSTRPESVHGANDDPKSESEMSVLVDEPPVRKRKKKCDNEETKGTKAAKGRKKKDPAKELSKDEETIKRLKSFVVACGVRKVWSKEFKDLDKLPDQIRRLRQMLTDLGMTGRMSMEQAKAIKAKREFEQELEDVQEFANKVSSGPSKRRRDQTKDNEEDAEESEIERAPKRRTARQSIMAFLGDESE